VFFHARLRETEQDSFALMQARLNSMQLGSVSPEADIWQEGHAGRAALSFSTLLLSILPSF